MTEHERLRIDYYKRRSNSYGSLTDYFIKLIYKYEPTFNLLTKKELRNLSYEDLGELVVAIANKQISITLGPGQDYLHGTDKKCAIVKYRNNSIKRGQWTGSLMVTGLRNKIGNLMVTAFNPLTSTIDHYYIPNSAFAGVDRIEITYERYTGLTKEPKWTGNVDTNLKWHNFKCDSFEDMLEKDRQATNLPVDTNQPKKQLQLELASNTFDKFFEVA
jgi:hypothetical protein